MPEPARAAIPAAGGAVGPVAQAAAPSQPASRKPTSRKPRSIWRFVRIALVAYLASYLAIGIYVLFAVPTIDALPSSQIPDTRGTNWLLVGSDSREGLTEEERKDLKTGGSVGARTDTIMLLHFGGGSRTTLVSIPRDSWVTIPAGTSVSGRKTREQKGKINAAYALGGPKLLVSTVEQATGLRVDHYGEIGFSGIVNLTNAVGGVTVCPERDYDDKKSGLKISAGCQTVDGKTALAYVRMRYADPKGDLGRVERQREFVSALVDEAISPLTLLNPWAVFNLARAGAKALAVDEGSNTLDMARMGTAMASVATGRGDSVTVPVSSGNYFVNGQSAVKWDTEQAQKLFSTLGAT